MFYDIYLQLCHSIKKSPSAVAVEIGISKPTVNRWKNGGSATDSTKLKIAEYFNISLDKLAESNDRSMPFNPDTIAMEFTAEDLEMLRDFKQLDAATQDVVRRVMNAAKK